MNRRTLPALFLVIVALALARALGASAPPAAPPASRLPANGWAQRTAPFCRALLRSPAPLRAGCSQSGATLRCADGSFAMFSQMRQDFYVYTRHFARLARRGVYLDVAANHPVRISNTFFMDACLGWTGLCVEGNPAMVPELRARRTCRVVPTCVSDVDGADVQFVLDGGTGGIAHTNKNAAAWKRAGKHVHAVRQTCTTLAAALNDSAVTVVDYLSLDVEGHELHVLKGVDWDSVVINVMTVEVTDNTLPHIEQFLLAKGYVRHMPTLDGTQSTGKLSEDVVFLHNSVIWGHAQ